MPTAQFSTKVIRPVAAGFCLRQRLFALMCREDAAAVYVYGPPGAGKTVLVSSHIESLRLRCIWYHVDEGDCDIATFFHYFAQAVQAAFPQRVVALPKFTPEYGLGLPAFARQYCRTLFSYIDEPCALVFDDLHHVPADALVHEVLRIACEEQVALARIYFTSRSAPGPSLARLRLHKRLLVVNGEDLKFNVEETALLLHKLLPHELVATRAEKIAQAVDGWAAGVVLYAQQHTVTDSPELAHIAADIFDYFVGEVFRNLSVQDQTLLMHLAIAPQLVPEVIAAMPDGPRCQQLLGAMADGSFFMARLPDGSYVFHALFREFLLAQANLPGSIDVQQTRASIAAALEEAGQIESAIALLIEGADWQGAQRLLLPAAPTLYQDGRLEALAHWTESFPADIADHHPQLLYWRAMSWLYRDQQHSEALFELAYEQSLAQGDRDGCLACCCGVMDAIFFKYAELSRMDPWIDAIEENLGKFGEPAAALMARVNYSMLVALVFRQPNHPRIGYWIEKTHATLAARPPEALAALLELYLIAHCLWQGRLVEARSMLNGRQVNLHRRQVDNVFSNLIFWLVKATCAMHEGQVEECLEAGRQGLALADTHGIQIWSSMFLCHAAAVSLNRGDMPASDYWVEQLQILHERLPMLDTGYADGMYAWRDFYAGRTELAISRMTISTAKTARRGSPYFHAAEELGLSLMLFENGQREEAFLHLDTGRDIGRSIGNRLIEFVQLLFQSYFSLREGDDEAALATLRQSFAIGCANDYRAFFFWPRFVLLPVCEFALKHEIEPEYVKRLIAHCELRPDLSTTAVDQWPWPIRIYTFGRFEVFKDNLPVKFSGKSQHRPFDLLKALIALGGQAVPESRLIDLLWPDAEGDRGQQALTTTIFRLRKLIGQEVLQRKDDCLTLSAQQVWVDCWSFDHLTHAQTEASEKRLHAMIEIYPGKFLQDDERNHWVIPMRERFHKKFVNTLCTDAELIARNGDRGAALSAYARGLEVDASVEAFERAVHQLRAG